MESSRWLALGLVVITACLGTQARGEVRPGLADGVARLRALHAAHPVADLRAEPATSRLGRRVRQPVTVVRTVEEVVVRRVEHPPRPAARHAPRAAGCAPDSWLAYHRALNEWHRAGSGMDERYRRYRAAEALWIAEATAAYGRPPPTAPDAPPTLPRKRRRR